MGWNVPNNISTQTSSCLPAGHLLRVSGLVGDSIVDGPGLRFTVFCQGCPHACPECHNAATWPFKGGTMMSAQEILAQARRYPLCRAVTLSGGEPFAQAEAMCEVAALFTREGYEVSAYSGYTFEQLLHGTPAQKKLLSYLDTLVDGPFIVAQRNLTLRFKGSENQRILDVPKSLTSGSAVLQTAARWTG